MVSCKLDSLLNIANFRWIKKHDSNNIRMLIFKKQKGSQMWL